MGARAQGAGTHQQNTLGCKHTVCWSLLDKFGQAVWSETRPERCTMQTQHSAALQLSIAPPHLWRHHVGTLALSPLGLHMPPPPLRYLALLCCHLSCWVKIVTTVLENHLHAAVHSYNTHDTKAASHS
jgi:hypothetical protein